MSYRYRFYTRTTRYSRSIVGHAVHVVIALFFARQPPSCPSSFVLTGTTTAPVLILSRFSEKMREVAASQNSSIRQAGTIRLSNAAQNPVTQMHGIFACRVGLAKELSLGSRGRGVLVTFAAARGGRADSPCARAAGRTAELWPPGSPRSRRARPVRLFWPGSPGLIVGLAPFLVPRLAPLLLGTETCRGLSR